jgi:hypothetical protein
MTEHLRQESPVETIERCSKHGADWLGDKSEFRYVGVDAPRATAKEIFDRHGFGDFVVEDPRPETVLKDSAKRGSTPDGYIQRPFVSPLPDTPLAIHVTKVTGKDESGDKYACLARVRIGHRKDPSTGDMVPFAVARPPEGQTEFSDSTARERALWIANATNHRLNHILTSDASASTRKALESVGAVKSLGGGNNYWVPAAVGERVHAFLDDVGAKLGAYYLRTPITTLGAPHAKTAFAQAAQVSLEDDLSGLEAEFEKALADSKTPTINKKTGKPRRKTATLNHKIELARTIKSKVALYLNVIDNRLVKRLNALSQKLEDNFTVLLDGGEVLWTDETKGAPPSSDEEPAPTTARSPGSEAELAAAAESGPELSDPFGWD